MKYKITIIAALLLIFSSCQIWHIAEENGQKYQVEAETIGEDSLILAMIQPYKTDLDKEMNIVIGKCTQDLDKDKPESLLTNWMTDALQKKTSDYYKKGVDFTVSNYGGIRIPVVAGGDITRGKIFELMPFDNMITVIEMADTTIIKLFEHMAGDNGWPISSNVSYEIKDQKPLNILINGKPIEKGETYTVSVSDYLANGGDKAYFFAEGKKEDLGVLIRDALIEYVTEETEAGREINSKLDGRLKYVE
jgi:2',3'-cyclic-nucleotide 2'-phosphodiesterase (5'-nucleotidase family)